MTIAVTPHLNFRGQARAALELYQSVFGGDLVAVTYADAGAPHGPGEAGQVMWGQVAAPNGFRVMAYDVPSALPYDQGIRASFVSVRGDRADEVAELWSRLVEGATVVQDLGPAGWAPLYGMLTDRFGVVWVLDVAVAHAG